MAVNNTIPVGAPYGQQIISSLDINEPEMHRELFRPYWNEVKEYLFLRALGFDEIASAETVSHFEANKSHTAFKVAAGNAGAQAGAATDLVLQDNSYDSSNRFYPRVRDIITFKGGVRAAVTAITAGTHTVTVAPLISTDTIPAVLAGETVIITSGVAGEASNTVDPAFARFTKYSHQLQIIKESVMASGSSLTDQTYIDVFNKSNEFQGVYSEAFVEGEQRLMLKLNGALLTGKQNTYATAPDDPTSPAAFGGKLLTSQGVLTTASERGSSVQVSAFNSMDDFDALTTALVSQYVSVATPVWMGMGLNLKLEIDNHLQGAFNKEDQQYLNKVTSEKLGTSLEVTVDFTKVNKTYIYMLDTVMAFSNPETYGATGYGYNMLGFGIPMGKQKDAIDKTKKYATFGMRYKGMGAYNRRFIADSMAGFGSTVAGEKPVHGYDYRKHEWMSHQGAQFMNANSFLYLY